MISSIRLDLTQVELLVRNREEVVDAVQRHRKQLAVAGEVSLCDRRWFDRHPNHLVRFRPERGGEFELLALNGEDLPAFIPDGLDPTAPLTWVAVVDILRAIGLPNAERNGSMRTRFRTVPIRSKALQAAMAEVFAIAVCQDLLQQIQHPTGVRRSVA